MPVIRSRMSVDGPVVDLHVWIGRAAAHGLIARGQVVPAPTAVRALIDTGADLTVVHPGVLRGLGSSASGRLQVRRVSTGGRFRWVDVHEVRLAFGGSPTPSARGGWVELSVAAANPADPRVLALIGRDMLAFCQFLYDGPHQELALIY